MVPFKWENTDYILGGAAVNDGGLILVGMPLPQKFSDTVKQLDASQKRYQELIDNADWYAVLTWASVLLTVLVLFSTTWLALYLSKLVTRPVVALAEATRRFRADDWIIAWKSRQPTKSATWYGPSTAWPRRWKPAAIRLNPPAAN